MGNIDYFVGNQQEFPILRRWNFFNHAGVAPLPARAVKAINQYAAQASDNAYIDCNWFRTISQLRRDMAQLINASAAEIAFIKNTSEGLALVAHGIPWKSGDRIVTTAVEYPANAYPWMDLVENKGVELIRVAEQVAADGTRQVPLETILQAAEAPQTRLVTLSHVEFASGQRHDLETIGQFCRQRNIRFCVDGIQSLGALPLDVRSMNIDYLSADGHKWLLGPEGAGIFFCRQELIEQTHPALIGWLNVQDPENFDQIIFHLKKDAGRFECGSYNVPGLLALKASVDLLREVGQEVITARIKLLTGLLRDGLQAQGWQVVTPPAAWSGIVSFIRPEVNPVALAKYLKTQKRIELAVRGGRLRVSPHFYNTPKQIDELLSALEKPAID